MNPNRKVALYTLGCKLNFSETSTIARQFADAGYARVSLDEGADVVVINTCSVTDHADKKCRNIVRKAMNLNDQAYVAVIGCYAQLKPEEIAAIPGVDIVLGANEKFNLLDHIDETKAEQGKIVASRIKETKDFIPSFSTGDRTRTFLKVQDGCNYFCSFCTIPLARGRSRSANVADTLLEAKKVAESGAKEVVLTGVNIGDFGTAHGESFLDLIKALDQIEGIERFRISSIEPNLLSDEIIDFCAQSKKFVPHFHIPLQSGSDEVLKKMRRRYLTDLYQNRIERIHQVFDSPCIGVDVIVGFPGESDAHFQETYNFLHALDVAYLHVFTYSERANTTALRIEEVVPVPLRQERNKKLRILSLKKKRAFYEQELGKTKTVLFEADEHENMMHGFTENYVKVSVPYNAELVNQLYSVQLNSIDADGHVRAEVLTPIEA
ncbi:MAG: tRNA (N(6)-L-threonylcarbamoyladenosine(37)-C(2))-methylthiotransferase MtaB [Flavobacteriales bacterium]|nr:tRNA (N(6)-L-threonylcarbamoyladenosine(37)-C(2))-methylthiotransferase MtaB [Flavobacteriales bacterium]